MLETMTVGSILVTGSSTGIGEACALHFDRLGWQVFAGVRRDQDGDRLRAQAVGRLHPVSIDVTDPASVKQVAKEVETALDGRGLTAVVNNAGVAVGGPVEYVPLDEWRRQLEVNVIGQLAVTQAILPLIRRSGAQGRIVFMGSIGGRISSPLIAPYNASKHAIEAIAESMRHELASTGIRVVVVEPGAVRTPIWDKGQASADDIEAALPADAVERYGAAIADLRRAMTFQARTGVEPAIVAGVVEKAVTSSRPAARYLVGRDAKLMATIARFLPDRTRDAVARRLLQFVSR
jgi:NAD(P)-dependent dehydrogenase (short-subunit alcohol dehydrogenase family)